MRKVIKLNKCMNTLNKFIFHNWNLPFSILTGSSFSYTTFDNPFQCLLCFIFLCYQFKPSASLCTIPSGHEHEHMGVVGRVAGCVVYELHAVIEMCNSVVTNPN